jgi:hypothetical protein
MALNTQQPNVHELLQLLQQAEQKAALADQKAALAEQKAALAEQKAAQADLDREQAEAKARKMLEKQGADLASFIGTN